MNPFAPGRVPHRKRPEAETAGPASRGEPIEDVPVDPVDDERVLQPEPNLFSRQTKRAAALGAVVASLASCTNPLAAPVAERPIRLLEPSAAQAERLAGAEAASAAGDYEVALGVFHEILAENPTITIAYLGIGDIYVSQKDYRKAEPAFRRAARLEPQSFRAQYGHGLALQMLHRFVEAVRAFQRAIAIDPDSDQANLGIATTFLQLNDPEQALAYAERAVVLDPASGAAHTNLGAIYEIVGRNPEAIFEYLEAIELMGNRPRLMMNLINIQAEERRYQEAVNTALTLVKIEPSAHAFERMGWCYFKLGQYDRSIESYRWAVKIEADHWLALNGIGVNALNTWLLSDKSDIQAKIEARNAFRHSLQTKPNQPKLVALLLRYDL